MSDLKDNPFSGLFSSLNEAENFSHERQTVPCPLLGNSLLDNIIEKDSDKSILKPTEDEILSGQNETETLKLLTRDAELVNQEIENIFLITVDKTTRPYGRPSHCLYLKDFHTALDDHDLLDLNLLESAVFERLMLTDPHTQVIKSCENGSQTVNQQAGEARILYYLFQSYCRIDRENKRLSNTFVEKCETTIFRNVQMALVHPQIFPNEDIVEQFVNLLGEHFADSNMSKFVNGVVELIEHAQESEDEPTLLETITPVFELLVQKLRVSSITDPRSITYILVAQLLTTRASVAQTFMMYSTPVPGSDPKAYEQSLLGSMLNISPLPRTAGDPYEFFNNPASLTQLEQENTERILWTPLNRLTTEVYVLLQSMLRLSNVDLKSAITAWIGGCLHENSGRAKIWNHMMGARNISFVSDGFILNLSSVLLKLVEPITVPSSLKLFLVDPTYSALQVPHIDAMTGLSEETCLLTLSEKRMHKDSYNFITKCFYMTHKCLQIGFHSLHERMTKLITEIRRLQRLYNEAIETSGESSEAAETIKKSMEQGTTVYFSAKTQMVQPETLKLMLRFYAATAKWVVNAAVSDDSSVFNSFYLPLPPNAINNLHYVPELFIDNITDFTTFLRRYVASYFEVDAGDFFLVKLLNLILVFMGSPDKMKNPHLRAKLAEALENVMPHPDEANPHLGDISEFARKQVFDGHPFASLIVPELMHVFVSIEMTGQSVAFEQKFNYRRPMYEVLEYVWNIECHREAFKTLAIESEKSIKSPDAPLFLRFINLLMNDANYLLDEALMHVSKLRDHQNRRTTEEYQQLSAQQRQEAEATYRHTGMLARFHNIMGRQTINTLKMLTSEIKSIFVHPINVERIGNMLNYFLLHLVGPKRKQLALKDKEEFDFKPQDLVSGICHIYVNLGDSERFLMAIASDGRSYSPELLDQAEPVLCRIGEAGILTELRNVASKLKEMSEKLKLQEESMENVPEEFLDAILGTLMIDPVILPSSQVVVDRSTIARHLLSDQSDPFNRSPLTMDMVSSDSTLRDRIREWMKENGNTQPNS